MNEADILTRKIISYCDGDYDRYREIIAKILANTSEGMFSLLENLGGRQLHSLAEFSELETHTKFFSGLYDMACAIYD